MSELDLNKLKQYRDEILKAEIGALLFNLGKTHIGFWKEKNGKVYFNVDDESFRNIFGFKLFSEYKKYYKKDENLGKSPFEYEVEKYGLKDFIFSKQVKFPFDIDGKSEINWVEYFKGDASNEDFIQKIFFRGCENINSGIDKGSPKEQIQGKLWISNAFGGFIKEIEKKDFDESRKCFFIAFDEKAKEQNWYSSPNFTQIREFVLYELKNWYSNLLSDSRMPVNDVTLYDQAYMSASMFKATLTGILLNTKESKNYINNPQSIKWQILGVQYDKLALAEKGLKPAHIIWYREASKQVDEKVKEIIELEYALGNEIYRDESGIYFIVPEGIGNETLNDDLQELKDKILYAFNDVFKDEVYPHIGLTKPSRGTMNLTYLLDKAKENFLKADYSKKSQICVSGNEIGICQICKSRLVKEKSDEDEVPMCNICKERKKGRIDKWLENQNGETIWIDEIGQNGSVALIGLKFELKEWLNGDLLSSLLTRNENYNYWLNQIQQFIKLFYSDIAILNDVSSISQNFKNCLSNEEKKFLGRKIGQLKSIEKELDKLKNFRENIKNNNLKLFKEQINTNGFTNTLMELVEEFFKKANILIENINKILEDRDIINKISNEDIQKLNNLKNELNQYNIKIFLTELTEDAYKGCKKWEENFNDYIRQIFFSSIMGNNFEKEIKNSILNNIIDWDNESIDWNNLNNEEDIVVFSKYLLQFILRKNLSSARLRRV